MKILSIVSIVVLIALAAGCDEMQQQVIKPVMMPDDEDPKDKPAVETETPKDDPNVDDEDPKDDPLIDDEDPKEDPPVEPETPAAAFVSATPSSGDISEDGSISLTFDNDPGDVTVSTGTVAGVGESRTINGPFPVGALALTIAWTNGNGSHTLNYNVIAVDVTPLVVTSSDPIDGTVDVDPTEVFENGIEITFSKPVTGDLRLMDGDDDVGWTVAFEGDRVTLTGNAGQELSHETMYEIVGTVSDSADNEAEISITFTTELAPAPPPTPVTLDPGEGLSIGAEAPDFTLPDGSGTNHTLSDSIGSSKVVLVFFRGKF